MLLSSLMNTQKAPSHCGKALFVYCSEAVLGLVSQLSLDELAVHTGDVSDAFVLGANRFTSTRVGAVAEAEFVHLSHHGLSALSAFYTALGKEGELRNLRRNEEHCRTVLTSSYASTATDAGSAVHSFVSVHLTDEDSVGVLSLARADRGVTTRSLDLIEGCAVYHAVLDNGECSRTPGFYGDHVAIVETTHVELAGSSTSARLTVGSTIDVE